MRVRGLVPTPLLLKIVCSDMKHYTYRLIYYQYRLICAENDLRGIAHDSQMKYVI